jgi:hypothetical protein
MARGRCLPLKWTLWGWQEDLNTSGKHLLASLLFAEVAGDEMGSFGGSDVLRMLKFGRVTLTLIGLVLVGYSGLCWMK